MKADKQCIVETDTNNFLIVRRDFLRDRDLSAKAMGILAFMLSCSDDWDYSIAGISKCVKDGKSAIRSAINELEQYGYVTRFYVKNEENGLFEGVRYKIRPTRQNPTSNPMSENRISDNRMSDNRTQRNTNKRNTKESSTSNINNTPNSTQPESFEIMNEAAGSKSSTENSQDLGSNLDYLIDIVHSRLRGAFPKEFVGYQNKKFVEHERGIVLDKIRTLQNEVAVMEWTENVERALKNDEFYRFLESKDQYGWCPSLGNVVESGCWERFGNGSTWL